MSDVQINWISFYSLPIVHESAFYCSRKMSRTRSPPLPWSFPILISFQQKFSTGISTEAVRKRPVSCFFLQLVDSSSKIPGGAAWDFLMKLCVWLICLCHCDVAPHPHPSSLCSETFDGAQSGFLATKTRYKLIWSFKTHDVISSFRRGTKAF